MVLLSALLIVFSPTLNRTTEAEAFRPKGQVSSKEQVNKQVHTQTEKPVIEPQVAETVQVAQPEVNCGDNPYKSYIYTHESGCRSDAVNSIGCYGVGQNCSGDVRNQCGVDFACQDAWFTNYALNRYGSWYNAYVFWINHHWW